MPTSPLNHVGGRFGAELREEAGWLMPAHYGHTAEEYRAALQGCALFDLSHRGKVEATGPDAVTFLQNLSTNDIAGLPSGCGCETFFTNMHAKAIAHALVYPLHDGEKKSVWLDTVAGLGGKLVKHLNHYLISEQVELADRTADLAQIHLAGPTSRAVLMKALGADFPPLELRQHVTLGTIHLRRNDPLGVTGYDLVCPRGEAGALWQKLVAEGASPAGLDSYELLRIEAGTPVYGQDFDETNIALEVGRPKAICYTKGCFLGQEPLVRIRDLGHVNRVLMGVKLDNIELLARGAKIFRDGKEVGHLTSNVVSPRLGPIALAYLRRGSQMPGTPVEVETAAGRFPAVVSGLPFEGSGTLEP